MRINKIEDKSEALRLAQKECLNLLLLVDKLCKENKLNYWIDGGTLLGAVRHNGFIPWDDDIDICLPKNDYDKLIFLLNNYSNKSDKYLLYFHDEKFLTWHDCFGTSSLLVDYIFPVKIDLIPVKFIKNTEEAIAIDKSLTNVASIFVRGKAKKENDILDIHREFLTKFKNPIKAKEYFFNYYNSYMNESTSNYDVNNCLINYSFNDTLVDYEREYYKLEDIYPLAKINFEGYNFSCPKNVGNYLTVLFGSNYLQPPPPEKRITHFSILLKNYLPKKDIKDLLKKVHYYGFINLAINRKRWQKILIHISSFLLLFMSLVTKFNPTLLTNFILYSYKRFKKQWVNQSN
ncbi:phosphorylcholine transferase LicD [Melioribacteraceae bacterium 4301-Me]|uniref:LicD family protein n=1 Tax=Pyranulibacter aquaticus TaxID=3163344 RepID=UPI003599378D